MTVKDFDRMELGIDTGTINEGVRFGYSPKENAILIEKHGKPVALFDIGYLKQVIKFLEEYPKGEMK